MAELDGISAFDLAAPRLPCHSEKGPMELLQLLSDVFSTISPKHQVGKKAEKICSMACGLSERLSRHTVAQKVDVSKEVPDQTADRLINFLKIIKYRPGVQDP